MPHPAPGALTPALPAPSHLFALAQAALLAALPAGGQAAARRNAWAGMSSDSARGRARREADAAVDAAWARQHRRTALA